MLAFHVDDVGITATSTANAVLLGWIWRVPVFVFFLAELRVQSGLLEIWISNALSGRSIGGAVLDGGVTVSKISEVVNVSWRQKCAGSKRVDRCISPLMKKGLC